MIYRWLVEKRHNLFPQKWVFSYMIVLILLQLLALSIPAQAEELIYNFDPFAQEQGLSQGQVFDIAQDVQGRIWIATYSGGVTIIDGSKEVYFSRNNGLPGSSTTSLYRDTANNMWIGTNKGVCYYNGYSIKTPVIAGGTSAPFVWDIEVDSHNKIWLATEQGVWYVENDTVYPYNLELLQYPFYHISKHTKGQLWFLSGVVGVYTLDKDVLNKRTLSIPGEPIVEVIHFLSDSHMLVGTTNGLHEFRIENGEPIFEKTSLVNRHVVSMAIDNENQLWVGTDEAGLFFFDKHGGVVQITAYQGIGHNRVYSLFKDESNNMWIGTDGAGVSLFKGFQFSELRINDLYKPSFITSVHIDKFGTLWAGTEGQGAVGVFSNRTIQYNTSNGLISNHVTSITSDDKGDVYFATDNGIAIMRGSKFRYLRKPKDIVVNAIEQVLIDHKGRLWAGTFGHGVQCITENKLFSSANGLTGDYIWEIFECSKNKLYVGTDEGITIIENDRVTDTIDRADGLLSLAISDINEDAFGNIWIGAEEGLGCLRNGTVKYYPIETLSNSNIIYSVVTDLYNHILVGTENGIIVLNTDKNGDIISTKRYSKNEGFFGIECNANAVVCGKDGDIYWGTTDGITKQISAKSWHTQMVAAPHISSIEISEKQGEIFQYANSIEPFSGLPLNLRLPHYKNNLTIQIGAPEYFHKNKIRFRYKLEGLDDEWSIPGKQTRITYNHLSPGKYTFAVQSLHTDFPKNEAATALYTFQINAPIYSTWWFRIIFIVSIISILLLFWNYRIYALRNRKMTLQKLVKERTAQLLEQKKILEKANKEISRSAHLKEQFLANTSHEMRTPLNVVIGFSNLLLNESLTPLQKKYTENIRHSGEHLKVIIGDLLDLSVIEDNKLRIVKKSFNYRRVIINTFNTLRGDGESKGLKVTLSLGKPANNVIGDAVRLTQIVSNLLRNAIKFTEHGSIEIRTFETLIDEKTTLLNLTIKDTGIGIPKDKFGQIFKSFTQVTGELTRKYGGTGLGLSIVKKLVDLHDGNITMESECGKGTIFHITLRYEISNNAERTLVKNYNIEKDDSLKNKKILIVDDNEINLSLAIETLTRYNSEIDADVAYDGKEACDLIEKNNYDLIIMDIQMPEMNGYEATRQIRSRKDLKAQVPILGMTAHAMKDERNKCLNLGMNDYLSKPFSPDTLLSKIKAILNVRIETDTPLEASVDKPCQSLKTLDIQKIKSIVGDSIEKEHKYLKMLQTTVPKTLEKMTDGINRKDFQQIKVTSHSLKSTFRYYGAAKLTELCLSIEQSSTDQVFDAIPQLAANVAELWSEVLLELDTYFNPDLE